jgi:hypothetical protein
MEKLQSRPTASPLSRSSSKTYSHTWPHRPRRATAGEVSGKRRGGTKASAVDVRVEPGFEYRGAKENLDHTRDGASLYITKFHFLCTL